VFGSESASVIYSTEKSSGVIIRIIELINY
jgi:hypothetical protein